MLSKSQARAFFLGGTVIFSGVFIALTVDTVRQTDARTKSQNLTDAVKRGKLIWEKNNCMGCHTILGEGAYFAPELGNVMKRWKVQDDPAAATEMLKGWMTSMPTGIEGRRQMPHFNLTDEEFKNLADFLLWTGKINTQNWPPNDAG